ncbi:ATP-binding protein [Paenibacillus sp. MER 180]|uniref:sensor histidine kinase n=1 Tax=Paenibacillus sp. MER 180 TaxID=2939570 RepID=UPI00203A8F93|nr:HAMP domain-containing sensor histidine kinase [Paenibacillus sp. MER 180]MCM3293925.1 ATP-binding protein [Paenibacillus sp. MER 180]
MKKRSVTTKLFAATSIFVLVLLGSILIGQKLFFERYYQSSKIQDLTTAVEGFSYTFAQQPADRNTAARYIGTIMNEYDASAAILDKRFQNLRLEPYYIDIKVRDKTVTIRITSDGTQSGDIPQKLNAGDIITVEGFFIDEQNQVMKPVTITKSAALAAEPNSGHSQVTGVITELLLPDQRSYNPYYQNMLVEQALREWMAQEMDSLSQLGEGQAAHMKWSDPWSGVNYMLVLERLRSGNEDMSYMFVMTSLQPVSEAVSLLTSYFIYVVPSVIMILLLLSFVFSRIVSKPLVALSQLAARMANLDFTVRTPIRSQDEFGELSRSLNILSSNLDDTLRELTNANTKLQEDMQEKARLERLRKELIANISHELKTPLGIVKGFAEGLQDNVAYDKRDSYVAHILSEVDKMNALIMDMLELSRYEAKAVRLNRSNYLIDEQVRKAVDSFDVQRSSKQLIIEFTSEEHVRVTADARRMEQVIVNLLSNAIRHAFEHSTIRIALNRISTEQYSFQIDNNGPQLSEEQLLRVWEQFYRGERSRDRKSGGTGLGLAICRHILELHGSTYGVENTKNGVSFYFTVDRSIGEVGDNNVHE